MYSAFVSNVVFPTLDAFRGTKTMRYLAELKKTQYLTREELDNLQNMKLRQIIKHAYENVPYYHEIMKRNNLNPNDFKNLSELKNMPVLKKKDVQENLDIFLATGWEREAIPDATGGSTGEPMKFYVTKEMSSWGSAANYRGWSWGGFQIGDKQALLWGSDYDRKKQERFATKMKNRVHRRIFLDSFQFTENDVGIFINKMVRHKARFLRAYASSVFLLSKYIIENNIEIRLEGVFTTAEKLFPNQRREIENAFSCPVFDGYGGRETSVSAHECNEHNGYHISEENGVLELVDNNGEETDEGHVIITDFTNYAMPFIRYEIGDIGKNVVSEKCNCGRALSSLREIEGRSADIIILPNGTFIHGEFFTHLFYGETDWVKEFQAIQEKMDRIIIYIVIRDGREPSYDYLDRALKDYLGNTVELEYKIVKDIPRTSSGKHRFTISKVPMQFMGGSNGGRGL